MIQQLQPKDIIQRSGTAALGNNDWKKVYAAVLTSTRLGKSRVLRHNNTLFWVVLGAPHEALVYVFNADPEPIFFSNFQENIKALQGAKFKEAAFITQDARLMTFIHHMPLKTKIRTKKNKTGVKFYDCMVYLGAA
jgi:hypothetical protein